MKSKVAKRNTDTARLWNNYVSQIATRKDKPPSATLFSSKDGRSAPKAEIGSTTRHTGTTKYAWGLLYFINYHVHDHEGFNGISNR